MKILVIRFSSIGDIVLTTPVLRCIKEQMPQSEIHFLVKKSFAGVLEGNPYIHQLHFFDNSFMQMARMLKVQRFDYVIDLHKNLRSFMLRFFINGQWFSYQKLSIQKFLLTKFHINYMPGQHISLRSVAAAAPLGIRNDGEGLDFFIPAGKGILPDTLPTPHKSGFIALVIGASYYTKKLPVDQLIALTTEIHYPIILVGGRSDEAEAAIVTAANPTKIFNACGQFTLHQSADIVRLAKVVISHDTGLQYIACALNKKVIAIWGGTSPLLDVEPYYSAVSNKQAVPPYQNFVVPGLTCQPCSNFGTKTCPKKHFSCMRQQNVKNIAALALKWTLEADT